MGKRSNFERIERDYYPTPYEAFLPVARYLPIIGTRFVEPCAGDGRLIKHLESDIWNCNHACDIEPQADNIKQEDVLFFGWKCPETDFIITNPPWERSCLHQMIEVFRNQYPTWLLFDADWMFTTQAKPYLKYCRQIVAVGRVSWMDNGTSGMDNCAWYNFVKNETETVFKGKT